MSPRIWLITGASSGFGYALASLALSNGDTVVATVRNPTPSAASIAACYPEHVLAGRLLILNLDVTNAQEISDVFKTVKDKYGRIDVVFNNAAECVTPADVGEFPERKARALFDANFWGAAGVSLQAIKHFRENSPPGGRLLQHSANSTLECNPGVGYDGASKAALDSFTEALSQEIDPKWNIKITIIDSGPLDTNHMTITRTSSLPSSGAIAHKATGNPIKGAQIFYRLSKMDEPPFRLPLHAISITYAKAKIESLERGIEGYASWSDEIF